MNYMENQKIQFEIREYFKDSLSMDEIDHLIKNLKGETKSLLRIPIPKLKDFNYKIEDIDSLSNAVSNSLSGSFAGNPILFDNKSAFDVLKMQFKE